MKGNLQKMFKLNLTYIQTGLLLITAILGATVTVLLGWKYNKESVESFANLALVCGAIIAVMNTVDSFWSFSSKWANYKAVYMELTFLESDVQNEENLSQDKIDSFYRRLREIIKDAKKSSLEFRKK